jgi:predicted double-glycine peptidase
MNILKYTEISNSYHFGHPRTDYSRIPRVVKEFGAAKSLKAEFIRTSMEELRRSNKPAVLYVYAGRISHATALLGFDGDEVILGEPLEGIKRIKTSEFQEQTRWTKLATIIAEQP